MNRLNDIGSPGLAFRKMHGLGNDFVIIDARDGSDLVTPDLARALGDRHRGVGFDQLAVMTTADDVDVELTFWNADGSLSDACGNATRCIANLLISEGLGPDLSLRTGHGILRAQGLPNGWVLVDMGLALTEWQDIPLSREADTLSLPIEGNPVGTSMGNPHCTFFVEDVEAIDLSDRGASIEHNPLFPERTNVQFAQVLSHDAVRVRVWERGVGPTLASGSSACAVTVAAARRGLTDHRIKVHLDGGVLETEWRDDGHVTMSGPVSDVFEGRLSPEFLASVLP